MLPMLERAIIIVGFLSACYFFAATGQIRPELEGQERDEPDALPQVEDGATFDNAVDEEGSEEVESRRMRLVTVDAAMTVDMEGERLLYLVIDNQVQVIKDGKFDSEFPRADFFLPESMLVQAAFVMLGSQDSRIFYGDSYGKFVTVSGDRQRRLKYGPARWFIRDGGPDAAGRRAGKVYVFKGCQVSVRNDYDDWGTPADVTAMGLPCDVHAAWKENEKMIILKGDMIWRWDEDGSVDGPFPFGANYELKAGYALLPLKDEMQSARPPVINIAPSQVPQQDLPCLQSQQHFADFQPPQ